MDSGPFRVPQPAERRVVSSRPEPVSRQPEEIEPKRDEEPEPVQRPSVQHHTPKAKKRSKRFIVPVIAIIIIIALIATIYSMWSNSQNNKTDINTNEYQAVFFTNGQVYFGKLAPFSNEDMKLTDIFYLQTTSSTTSSTNPQETSSDSNNVQLIKLGNEIHGPEDEMIIAKDQLLFYENLKPSGKVSESIAKYQAANK